MGLVFVILPTSLNEWAALRLTILLLARTLLFTLNVADETFRFIYWRLCSCEFEADLLLRVWPYGDASGSR